MVVWFWPEAPGTMSQKSLSAPLVMGSLSLNAHRNGLSNCPRTSHARRLASAAGSSGRDGHEHRELARPFFVGLVGKRSVVGRDHVGRGIGHASAAHDASHGERGHLLGEFLPRQERLAHVQVAGGQAGVGGDHPPEPVGMLRNEPKADEAAPVLARRASGR